MSRPVVGAFGAVAPVRDVFGPPPPPPGPITVPLAAIPRLADATVIDPSSLGTWSEVEPGLMRFTATGFAAATTLDAPTSGASLVWPVTRADGAAAALADIVCGLGFALVQEAGTPGSATNYAIGIGIGNATLTEYMMLTLDHATSVGRGGSRVSGTAYATNATAAAGKFANTAIFERADGDLAYWAMVCGQLSAIETLAAATAFGPTGAPNRNSAATLGESRYFLSFVPRGVLGSQPANIDVRFAFNFARLTRSISVPVP